MTRQCFFITMLCCTFLSTTLSANVQFEEAVEEIKQIHAEIQYIEEHQIPVLSQQEKEEISTLGAYHENFYKGCYQFAVRKVANGFGFFLMDETFWEVRPKDQNLVAYTWEDGDGIFIGTSSHFFSNSTDVGNYRFEAYNRRNHTTVKVEPRDGPMASKCLAVQGIGVNYIILSDGSCWEVSSFDAEKIKRWKVTHSIILGINNTWDSNWNPYILYNTDTNGYVRASIKNLHQLPTR